MSDPIQPEPETPSSPSSEASIVETIRITEPRDGLPEIVTEPSQLENLLAAMASGTGPVALDAERASGFKYSQRAYLIQIRRQGSGSHLIDPTLLPNLNPLQEALTGVDWILHAASQDLVCLAEVGLKPTANVFDTELAGRLLGLPRVGLGPLIESQLGYSLAKEHSAADWSTRPLPESWLKYAALDVEFLIELWELLEAQLVESNKHHWALQEFDYVKRTTGPVERVDPWRRTSGMHVIRNARELAVIREVWHARDEIAREQDIAAGRILSDSHIVTLASSGLTKESEIKTLSFMHLRNVKRNANTWISAAMRAHDLPDSELPPLKLPVNGPPAPRNWESRNPKAWRRLEYARSELSTIASDLVLPVENLMTPDTIRRVLWTPPETPTKLVETLYEYGAREWQVEIVEPVLETAIWESPSKTNEL
jgi:ribonuclease D